MEAPYNGHQVKVLRLINNQRISYLLFFAKSLGLMENTLVLLLLEY